MPGACTAVMCTVAVASVGAFRSRADTKKTQSASGHERGTQNNQNEPLLRQPRHRGRWFSGAHSLTAVMAVRAPRL